MMHVCSAFAKKNLLGTMLYVVRKITTWTQLFVHLPSLW